MNEASPDNSEVPSQGSTAAPAPAADDLELSSGQLMMALQLGIFLPFLGPLVILAIWGMNRHKPSSALLLKIGLAFIFMQLLTASLIYGYYISHKLPAETLTY